MQFIVFVAFAVVLSVPPEGPPWPVIASPMWTWVIVLAQVASAGAVGGLYTRLVKGKLEREPAWLPAAQRRLVQGNATIRVVLLGGLGASIYLTAWTRLVRSLGRRRPDLGSGRAHHSAAVLRGGDCVVAGSVPGRSGGSQVALEQRLWASAPARPVWRLRAYLSSCSASMS